MSDSLPEFQYLNGGSDIFVILLDLFEIGNVTVKIIIVEEK